MEKKSERPGLKEALDKNVEARLTILYYIWPSIVIIFGAASTLAYYIDKGLFSRGSLQKYFGLIIAFAILVNYFYYKWAKNR